MRIVHGGGVHTRWPLAFFGFGFKRVCHEHGLFVLRLKYIVRGDNLSPDLAHDWRVSSYFDEQTSTSFVT